MKFPVFDLHCDTALALLGEDLKQTSSLKHNDCHIDLDRASTLGGYAQCFACFTTTVGGGPKPVEVFEREIDTILREMERNYQQIALAYTPEEISQNLEKGMMSGILTIEGPAGFGFDPELLEDLHRLGFRITTLGWNEKNPLTGSHKTGGGLTARGAQGVILGCTEIGLLVRPGDTSARLFDTTEIHARRAALYALGEAVPRDGGE